MFLKSLNLKGFKSFADPCTLMLEPGVTVVVGPNGSGKSNVVDAVAWVLGAQGPRTVRSSKMEDVIFAGSADRPALGRAEVSITIDNRAGRLPGGLAEITITRTLFRSGDSEYALNGQPCRLLDIQELLSDSGVGRQQHVIVSQGQLAAILDSRPEDRRAVIEEAAGVLKHRRRRERAERRLAATEENLDRLGDLLREVRRQMRPLERQAKAARSHASLSDELLALRLYLVGQELSAFDSRAAQGSSERERLAHEEATLAANLRELDAAADATAAELANSREEDLVAALTRVQSLVERCRGLGGVVVERRRSIAQALDASADVDVVSTLEADAARVASELEATRRRESELAPDGDEVRRAEQALAADLAAHEAAYADSETLRSAEGAWALARGELESVRGTVAREQRNLERAEHRRASAQARREALDAEATELAGRREALRAEATGLEASAEEAHAEAARETAAVAAADGRRRDAERTVHRLEARAEALATRVEEARGATATTVGDDAGVLGTLDELVDVDDEWRAGFEAAVGFAARALVVGGAEPARSVLARLVEHGVPGTVLRAPLDPTSSPPSPARAAASPPPGSELMRDHVHARRAPVSDLLDTLLAGVVCVDGGWREAVDVALEHPELVIVSREGGRFSPNGWVVGGSSAALDARARQAAAEAEVARARLDDLASQLGAAQTRAADAGDKATEISRRLDDVARRAEVLAATLDRARVELEAATEGLAEATRHRDVVAEALDRANADARALEARLPGLQEAAVAAAGRLANADDARRRLEERRSQVALLRRDLEVRVAGLAERRAVLEARLGDVERRLSGHAEARARAEERRRALEAEALAASRLGDVVEGHAARLGAVLDVLRDRRARQLEDVSAGGARLESLRHERAHTEERLTSTRHDLQRVELDLAECSVRREAAQEAARRELGCTPEEAIGAPRPDLPEGRDAAARAAEIETELASLGPVNPLALEELGELEERHRFLEEQVEDVRRARRELHQVIRAVDDEIMRVFTEAFADVSEHFRVLVETLFPGGSGRLSLTEPEDLLNTGVEVEARPAGKNVRKLSLLSGGERSLVSLAFLFAVFRSRPSPFYLLDEVEAALDDVNLHRFLDLLHEFREEAQLIIVSHQKRTMESADALYGVTMTPGGSSKVVSQKVGREPESEPAVSASPA